jgi:hypothetical protein
MTAEKTSPGIHWVLAFIVLICHCFPTMSIGSHVFQSLLTALYTDEDLFLIVTSYSVKGLGSKTAIPFYFRRENKEDQETEFLLINTGKGTAGGNPTSTWARLIRRIFEVDPRRSRRKHHRPASLGRRLSTTSLTWTPTYRTRYTRIEPIRRLIVLSRTSGIS